MIKVSISGLRGTVDGSAEGLTASTVVDWVRAFGAWVDEVSRHHGRLRIALGRDGRLSSPALLDLARAALVTAGADVVDLGLMKALYLAC